MAISIARAAAQRDRGRASCAAGQPARSTKRAAIGTGVTHSTAGLTHPKPPTFSALGSIAPAPVSELPSNLLGVLRQVPCFSGMGRTSANLIRQIGRAHV